MRINRQNNRGLLVVLSSPSGGGKTTIIKRILARYPDQYVYSISATTRKPRPGEVDGKDYFFLSEQQFQDDIKKGRFLEWEQVHGYWYGTRKDYIEQCINDGKSVLLDIDVNGALRVAKNYPDRVVTIFIQPPSLEELIQRLRNRKTDSAQEISRRLERIPMEMKKAKLFDYVVVNNNLDQAVDQVIGIVERIRNVK